MHDDYITIPAPMHTVYSRTPNTHPLNAPPISVRVSYKQRDLIRWAAKHRGVTTIQFIRWAAYFSALAIKQAQGNDDEVE